MPTWLSRYWSAERYSNTAKGRKNWWTTYFFMFAGSTFLVATLDVIEQLHEITNLAWRSLEFVCLTIWSDMILKSGTDLIQRIRKKNIPAHDLAEKSDDEFERNLSLQAYKYAGMYAVNLIGLFAVAAILFEIFTDANAMIEYIPFTMIFAHQFKDSLVAIFYWNGHPGGQLEV